MAWITQTFTTTTTKLVETPGWDAGARTIAELTSDGGFTFSVGQAKGIVCGFNTNDNSADYREIQHGFLIETNRFKIVENGVQKASWTSYSTGAVFKVARSLGVVTYYRDDVLIYTSLIASTGTVFLDCSLYANQDTILDATIFETERWIASIDVELSRLIAGGTDLSGSYIASLLSPLVAEAEDLDNNRISAELSLFLAFGTTDDFNSIECLTEKLSAYGLDGDQNRINVSFLPIIGKASTDDFNSIAVLLSTLTAFGEDTPSFVPEYNSINIELRALQTYGLQYDPDPATLDGELSPLIANGFDVDVQILSGELSPLTVETYLGTSNYFIAQWPFFTVSILAPQRYIHSTFTTSYQQRNEKLFTTNYSLGIELQSLFESNYELLDYDNITSLFEIKYRDSIQSITSLNYSDYHQSKALFDASYTDYSSIRSLLNVQYTDNELISTAFQVTYEDRPSILQTLSITYSDTTQINSLLINEYGDTPTFNQLSLFGYSDRLLNKSIVSFDYSDRTLLNQLFTIGYSDPQYFHALHEVSYEDARTIHQLQSLNYEDVIVLRKLFESSYLDAPSLSATFTSDYSDGVITSSIVSMDYRDGTMMSKVHSFEYSTMPLLSSVIDCGYTDRPSIQSLVNSSYSDKPIVGSLFDSSFTDYAIIHHTFDSSFTDYAIIRSSFDSSFTDYAIIRSSFDSQYADKESVNALITFGYEGVDLAPTFSFTYGLLDSCASLFTSGYQSELENIRSLFNFNYGLNDEDVHILTGSCWIELNNRTIAISEVSITADEGSSYYQCSATILNELDYRFFEVDTDFIVHLFNDEYHFVVDSKNLSRSIDDEGNLSAQMTIEGLSPIVRYAAPRSLSITKTWDSPTRLSDFIEELIGVVDYQCIDDYLPAYRLSAENAIPLDLAKSTMESIGSLIESLPDGSIKVRKLWPTNISLLNTSVAHHTLNDDRLFSMSESPDNNDWRNKFRIIDVDSSVQDNLEFVADEDDDLAGTLYAYPSPWRDGLTLRHTRGTPIYLSALTEELIEMTVDADNVIEPELIEFQEGQASSKYPMETILSFTWLAANLGAVSFVANTKQLTSSAGDGYSLAEIRYTTRRLKARTSSSEYTSAQYLLEEL